MAINQSRGNSFFYYLRKHERTVKKYPKKVQFLYTEKNFVR